MLLIAAGIGLAGSFYISAQHNSYDSEIHRLLAAAATMKAAEVAEWRAERCGDAAVIAAGIRQMPAVERVLRGRAGAEDQQQTAAWLNSILTQYHYESVILAGISGKVLLSAGTGISGPVNVVPPVGVVFSEISRDGNGQSLRLGVTTALRSLQGEVLGSLLLDIDPDHFLYPLLRDWPGAGETGELLLVRQDGDSVLFLNDPRLRPGSALKLRVPLGTRDSPAALAIRGAADRVDGVDYRGQPVVAAARPVAESGWFVEAKQDRSEVFAPQNRSTLQLVGLLLLLLLLTAASVGLLLHRQRVRAYRERYEAEIARKDLLGRYDFLTRYANDAILLWEGDGNIIEVNDRALEMFGYTREELLGRKMLDLKPAELFPDFRRAMQTLEEQHGLVFETANRRKNGRSFPTEVSACRFEIEDRHLGMSIIRDISERKEAEQHVRRLNRLYLVLSRCNAAIFRSRSEAELFQEVCRIVAEEGGFRIGWVGKLDPATNVVAPIAKAGAVAGYLDEVTIMAGDGPLSNGPTGRCIREGRSVASTDFAHDSFTEPWREAAARYGLRSSICLPLSCQGRTMHVLGMYSSEALFFSREEVELAEEIGESLTFALGRLELERERERAEQERRISQERLELALDASNEGYWDWNVETNEWYLSPRFSTMLGYEPGEFQVDQGFLRESVHPEDREEMEKQQMMLLHGKVSASSLEFRARKKDGGYIWLLGKAKVVARDARGLPQRVVGTRLDITERKSLEQQFLQAQKMESVGRLAGGVAHDFNNHLTVINGYSALLGKQLPKGSAMAGPMQAIREAGERAAGLTRQLLAFSRKEIEHREVLDPNAVITGMRQMIARLMGENVTLSLELEPEVGLVCLDPTHLEQVILNLTINARDAVGEGGNVTVRTGWAKREGAAPPPDGTGKFVQLTVSDNGCGMTPEVQQHIFEPFYTTKDRSHGTGLGLATVFAIVQGGGGFIEVESAPGKGSSFQVFLPRLADLVVGAAKPQSVPLSLKGSETILVVEDDEDVREIAGAILRHFGYQVLTATAGDEALALAADLAQPIAAVVSDLRMPGMSGPELVRELLRARPRLKVLYVSGYAGETLSPEALAETGGSFVPKPFTPEKLAAKVRELLSGGASA